MSSENNLDFQRQAGKFDRALIQGRRIDIVGYGATGSHVGELLVKIGADNIHIWDDDTIAPHNIPNQKFFLSDIGKLKVDGGLNYLKAISGVEPIRHAQKVTSPQVFGPIVFMLVDSMEARKKIWQESIKLHPNVEFFVETRLSDTFGFVYMVNPLNAAHIKAYEARLRNAEDVAKSVCGDPIVLAPTVSLIATKAVSVLQEFLWAKGDWTKLYNEYTLFTYSDMLPIEPKRFPQDRK